MDITDIEWDTTSILVVGIASACVLVFLVYCICC